MGVPGWCTAGGYQGGVQRVGTRVGIQRVGTGRAIPGYYPAARGDLHMTAERAPEALQGLEWVVIWRSGALGDGGGSQDHPTGPVGACGPSLSWDPDCRLSANRGARFRLLFYKVSQNGEVSSKYVDKACHSPCFIFRSQKSPLGIPRFPFLQPFSHKELMVPF